MGHQRRERRNRLSTPVFIFDDYVDYLKAWYGYAKRFKVTQRTFIEQAGVGTQAYFSDILARRKKLSLKHVAGFATALEMSSDEEDFFNLLVLKEHADKGHEKEKVLKRLAKLREKFLPALITDTNAEYFSSWKYPVVREYIVSRGYVASLREIKKAFLHFTMSLGEVRATVNKLVLWKMVKYTGEEGGIVSCDDTATVSYNGMPHTVVKDVKRLFIESSVHAMETLPREKRHITMAVKGMSRKKYELFCKKIDELRKQFLTEEDPGEGPEFVYGLNVQLFPLMTTGRNDREDVSDDDDGSRGMGPQNTGGFEDWPEDAV